MKTRFSLIQPFAMLGIILTLSMFFSVHAAAQHEFESPAAVLARIDARANTNRLLWFSMGCVSGTIGMYLLILGRERLSAELMIAGSVIGGAPGLMIPFGNAPPPSDRLIGKSPEYVEVYVFSYKEEKRELKGWSGLGGLLGITVGGLIAIRTLLE